MAQDEQTWSVEYQNTLISQMPQLADIFEDLERGVTPSAMQMLAGLSQMVGVYVDHDILSPDAAQSQPRMSRKKCLFCS